jgi:5-methylcytosine-specific restriction endonuclease McrA
MALKDHFRHSAKITRTPRWKALRMQVLERDGWRCVLCPERRGLEVDHIQSVRTRPDLAWSLDNLQCLCGRCHARKTRLEIGLGRPDPAREAWKRLVRDLDRNPSEKDMTHA